MRNDYEYRIIDFTNDKDLYHLTVFELFTRIPSFDKLCKSFLEDLHNLYMFKIQPFKQLPDLYYQYYNYDKLFKFRNKYEKEFLSYGYDFEEVKNYLIYKHSFSDISKYIYIDYNKSKFTTKSLTQYYKECFKSSYTITNDKEFYIDMNPYTIKNNIPINRILYNYDYFTVHVDIVDDDFYIERQLSNIKDLIEFKLEQNKTSVGKNKMLIAAIYKFLDTFKRNSINLANAFYYYDQHMLYSTSATNILNELKQYKEYMDGIDINHYLKYENFFHLDTYLYSIQEWIKDNKNKNKFKKSDVNELAETLFNVLKTFTIYESIILNLANDFTKNITDLVHETSNLLTIIDKAIANAILEEINDHYNIYEEDEIDHFFHNNHTSLLNNVQYIKFPIMILNNYYDAFDHVLELFEQSLKTYCTTYINIESTRTITNRIRTIKELFTQIYNVLPCQDH